MDILDFLFTDLGNLTFIIVGLCATYLSGSLLERKHFASLKKREYESLNLPLLTQEYPSQSDGSLQTRLVYGNCVISADFFKQTLGKLRSLFGGNIASYETVLDRTRREALLRMKDDAQGAFEIIAVRLITTQVGPGKVEVVAYGTAVYQDAFK